MRPPTELSSRSSARTTRRGRISGCATAALTLLACAAPLSAQDLVRPEGWMTRFDNPTATESQLETFVGMPPGWHVTTGPAGIFWDPASRARGDFRAEMEVFLFDPEGRREAFGMFVGGRNLESDAQQYTYFLLRDGGQFIIKRREGTEAPTLHPWTSHDAILAYADRGEAATAKNILAIEARGDTVRFFVNGSEVASASRAEAPVDGIVGFRVNHRLNLHVSRLEVTQLR